MGISSAASSGWHDRALIACKYLGLFRWARFVTRRGLRILCYHGFASGDELAFRPGLFTSAGTFRRRLETLRDGGYPVLRLDEAVDALAAGQLPSGATVITVDDVFHSFKRDAWPLLCDFGMPVTAYLTTYYAAAEKPVFRLIMQYLFWRTTRASIDLADISPKLSGIVTLDSAAARQRAALRVVDIGTGLAGELEREALTAHVAALLNVDHLAVLVSRAFHIVTCAEARQLLEAGVDLQLHTHRHRCPPDQSVVVREITDNRQVLESIAPGRPFRHFCYPSGRWSPEILPWLRALDVKTATTCDPGINYHTASPLALRRILDAEDVSQIRFEAEISGFKDIMRRLKAWLTRAPLEGTGAARD